jgi:hypothetical protein
MNESHLREAKAFDTLGIKHYASPEEIDRHWRRLMLQAHPDKAKDDGKKAKEYNESREIAKQYAQNPANQGRRETMRDAAETKEQKEQVDFLYRVKILLHDKYMKTDQHMYDPTELSQTTKNWTPQQRQEAEDAIRFGLERHHLDDALERLEALRAENARLRVPMPESLKNAIEAADKAKAALMEETKRTYDIAASLAKEQQRADEERERADAGAAALEKEKQRAGAVEAELMQCKQQISQLKKRLAAANTNASKWEQRSVTACKDEGAARAHLQQVNEQKILLEQKLTDAGQRVEASEAKAKEWEAKCSVLQESLEHELQLQRETMQQSHAQETETETESITKRKRIKLNENEKETFKSKIDHFVQHSIRSIHGSFISTDSIVQAFTTNGNKMISAQLFYKTLAASLKQMHPNAQHKKSEHAHGYTGISLEDS